MMRVSAFIVSLRVCASDPVLLQMNWNLWRCGSSGNFSIPAMTMSYRMVPTIFMVDMYPWFWWAPPLFDNHASWFEVRCVSHCYPHPLCP